MRSRIVSLESTDETGPELITLEALKLELGITDDSEDAALTARIARWSRMFAEYCGRTFAFSEVAETFTFDVNEVVRPGKPLVLSLYPVIDIVSVTMNGNPVDYDIDGVNGFLYLKIGCWAGTVDVIYSGGYLLPDEAPGGLVEAIIAQIRVSRDDRDTAVQSLSHGDTRVSFFQTSANQAQGSICSVAMDFLAPFKRPSIA